MSRLSCKDAVSAALRAAANVTSDAGTPRRSRIKRDVALHEALMSLDPHNRLPLREDESVRAMIHDFAMRETRGGHEGYLTRISEFADALERHLLGNVGDRA